MRSRRGEEEEEEKHCINMANIIVLGTVHLQAPVICTVLQAGRQAAVIMCYDLLDKRIAY